MHALSKGLHGVESFEGGPDKAYERITPLLHREGCKVIEYSIRPERTACEILVNNNAVVVVVSHALDRQLGRFRRVALEAEFPKGCLRHVRSGGVTADKGGIIAPIEENRIILMADFRYPSYEAKLTR